ncbi:MAG: transposase [Oscillospiraceae bacterium]|nr:transposase [Oscillospiraceae bacterium]MBR1479210.1 transposase [Lachnospiraceae bacterium]
MGKKNVYSAEYKSKIVIEALQGEKSIGEIATRENINPTMLKNWKTEFIANAANAFNGSKSEKEAKRIAEKEKKHKESLEREVGHLTMQVNWLKKKSDELFGSGWEEKYDYPG